LKLGLHIAYWGLGLDAREQLSLVQEAERLDYSAVWVGEAYGSDAATVLAWIAAKTERIGLGSGVFQMPGRSPAMTAMTAATIDQLSGGRFRLGLGSSGPQVAEGWHGQRFTQQLTRTREYVDVVRKALEREPLSYEGETLTLPLPDGPGKALKLTIGPVQPRIPIYLAALGPKNTELVGAIADGWLPVLFSPAHVGEATHHLAAGAAGAGRALSDVSITPIVYTSVHDDLERARDALRPLAWGPASATSTTAWSVLTASRRRPAACRTSTSRGASRRRWRPSPPNYWKRSVFVGLPMWRLASWRHTPTPASRRYS
jgi:F420-dependent oxidoreductase-like protein